MQKGDHQGAIVALKKAVELDPELGRNHTNLCAAYILAGDEENGWVHARKSVLNNTPDANSKQLYAIFCDKLIKQKGLDQPGTTLDDIINALGEPDAIFTTNSTVTYRYGTCTMIFKDDKLISCRY